MRTGTFATRMLAAVATGVLLAGSAAADTIVLKNGRRIVASNVTDANGKVTYETPAGELSLPKSLVERIEKDDFSYTPAAKAAVQASIAAPAAQPVGGYEQVMALAVHDEEIDYGYLAKLDTEARSGSQESSDKQAVAHHAAAQFLASKGSTDSAISQYKQALVFAPQNIGLLMNVAVLYLRESQFNEALEWLERARRIEPNSADVPKLAGWAYYGANKIDQAVAEWKRAQQLNPYDQDVVDALEKAEKDKSEEESYREGETLHFALKYSGAATPELAREILRSLEEDFDSIASQLNYTPPGQIGVILYTNEAFADITRAPGWVGALNDGRLRIPVQGLTSVTPDLARVLRHELTHSFVGQKTRGRAPVWLQEGVAQYIEGRRSAGAASGLVSAANTGFPPEFGEMEGSWMQLSESDASYAYAWSLAAIESMVDAGGINDVGRLLDSVAIAPTTEQALRESLRLSYSDLGAQTVAYLRHQYGH
jgi:tetratricopeptide (TPR) repeat protein